MILLTRTHDINYGLIEPAEVEDTADLLANVFSGFDPLAVTLGLSSDEMRELIVPYCQRAPGEALTVIAQHQPSGKLIGAMLTDDFASPPPVNPKHLSHNFEPIAHLLEELDDKYRRTEKVMRGGILHLFMLGVATDFGGEGIASRLVQHTIENGKRKGYKKAVAEATGLVSQHIFRNHGFVERSRIAYKEFMYRGRPVFNSIAKHEAVILMECVLSS